MARRKTYEEVKKFIEVDSCSGCKLLSRQYTNTTTKLKIMCKCGTIYHRTFKDFKGQKQYLCLSCAEKKRRKSLSKPHRQFMKEVYDLVKCEYSVLDIYENNKTKVKIRHNKCGNYFYMTPDNFLTGQRCPRCIGHKLTNKEFRERVLSLTGNEFQVMDEYVNNATDIRIKHMACNRVFKVKPSYFLDNKNKCPICRRERQVSPLDNDDFKEKVYRQRGIEYSVLGTYKGLKKKVLMRHNICGHEYKVTPSNFLIHKTKCPNCFRSKKKTISEYRKEILCLVGQEYQLLSNEYINNHTKLKMKHVTCGSIFFMKPNHFLSGVRCPTCLVSKGERAIRKILLSYNINFTSQYSLRNCVYKKNLFFDFALLSNDDGLKLLIEYDGEQHFKPIDFAGRGSKWAEQQYKKTLKRDAIKNQYCADNNIPLLRIPYWEFDNIEQILEEWLTEQGVLPQENLSADD